MEKKSKSMMTSLECKYCKDEASSFTTHTYSRSNQNHTNTYLNERGETVMRIKTSPSISSTVSSNVYPNATHTFSSFNSDRSSFETDAQSQQVRRELFLPLFYTNYYGEHLHSWSDDGKQIKSNTNLATNHNHYKTTKSQHPVDDVRSAALALTSLSLSPGNGKNADNAKSTKEWSSINYFIFPPTNTPTDDGLRQPSSQFTNPSVTSANSPLPNTLSVGAQSDHRPYMKKRHDSTDSEDLIIHEESYSHVKPRSYSQRDYDRQTTHPVPILNKPRSYSFDAVGRATKYPTESDYHSSDHRVGYHSAPTPHSKMLQGRLGSFSGDDGIGSSSGSADSIEHVPSKRKLKSRTVFRCMWRGCDKELTTLSGIILHVRHSHIGTSNAGEEEFYFNDVNLDSSTTSGVSSCSLESIPDECSRRKYRKSVSEETLENVDIEKPHDKTLIDDNTSSHTQTTSTIQKKEACEAHENEIMFSPVHETKKIFSPAKLIKQKPTQHFIENLLKDKTKTVEHVSPAHHIGSPSFNMNFMSDLQVANNTRMFLPSDGTAKKKAKGRKKCRKVYGMSNKDLWCTQCRWKKACTRFT